MIEIFKAPKNTNKNQYEQPHMNLSNTLLSLIVCSNCYFYFIQYQIPLECMQAQLLLHKHVFIELMNADLRTVSFSFILLMNWVMLECMEKKKRPLAPEYMANHVIQCQWHFVRYKKKLISFLNNNNNNNNKIYI